MESCGKFEYYQLLGEVFLFEDWLWEWIEVDYACQVQNPLDDTSIIEGKLADYKGYLTMSGPMRVFDYVGSKSSAKALGGGVAQLDLRIGGTVWAPLAEPRVISA